MVNILNQLKKFSLVFLIIYELINFFSTCLKYIFLFTVNDMPVLKAASIKFIMTFRSVLPRQIVVGSLPDLVRHLSAENVIVHSYAAYAIEKILSIRGSDNLPM